MNTVIDNFKKQNLSAEKTANSLTIENPKTPKFYKQENPQWPVVNSVNSHASNFLKFVDHNLQPHAQNVPSYVAIVPLLRKWEIFMKTQGMQY